MGVAKKMKRLSSQPNVAKPKKETVAKTSKKQPKPVEGKKSSRIQNQTLKTKVESKTSLKNKKSDKKTSSPALNKVQKISPPRHNKKSAPQTSSPTQNKKSAQKATTSDAAQKKMKTGPKAPLPLKAKNAGNVSVQKSLKSAKTKKGGKASSKNVELVAKSANVQKSAVPTKKNAKQVQAVEKPVQKGSKKPSVASKLQKKKRKSVKSPLKKTLGGKIVKSKKSSLGKKGLPAAGKTGKFKKPRKSQLNLAVEQNRGVVYFSHLPHGFYENELKEYCGQFGDVTGVHVPRSVNGNSRGYAFVEFKHPEVAEVVASTMNNYLMHTRLVKAELVPLERQKPWIFRNGIDAVKVARKKKADALAARTKKLTPEEEKVHQKKALARVNRLKKKLAEKGINLDFTVVSK